MTALTVNRSDLSWALTAVLPHVGSAARDLDWVGFRSDHTFDVFATDGYTVGVAGIEWSGSEATDDFYLSPSEARDLLKFVRPTLVATHQDSVKLLVVEHCAFSEESGEVEFTAELHVGIYDSEGNLRGTGATSEPLSGVWSVRVPGKPFEAVYRLVKRVKGKDEGTQMPYVFKPDLLARLSKAARYETDRLTLQPVAGDVYGAAYVTVGDHFEAAVAGLSYELPGSYEPADPETVVYGDQYDVEVTAA